MARIFQIARFDTRHRDCCCRGRLIGSSAAASRAASSSVVARTVDPRETDSRGGARGATFRSATTAGGTSGVGTAGGATVPTAPATEPVVRRSERDALGVGGRGGGGGVCSSSCAFRVLRRSADARRSSARLLPSVFANSGSFCGPITMRPTTRITNISPKPMLPNMKFPALPGHPLKKGCRV
jgi:hypothetical protein